MSQEALMKVEETHTASRFLRVADIARELNLSRSAAYRLAERLPHLRLGGAVRVERADLEAHLATAKIAGKGAA